MQRPWITVYDEHTEDSGYEHVNPNVAVNSHIAGEEDGLFMVLVTDVNGGIHTYDFPDVKSAQRFIKRLGGIE